MFGTLAPNLRRTAHRTARGVMRFATRAARDDTFLTMILCGRGDLDGTSGIRVSSEDEWNFRRK